jgi:Ni/Co efflux regulator RcnB
MKKILALVTALSFAVPVISDAAFAAPPGSTKPAPGKPGGGGGGGHKPGRPGGGGGGGRPPGGGGGGGRPPGGGGGHKPRPPGNGHKPRPPGNGHKPRPPGNGHRPRPPGYGGGKPRPPSWTKPRPNQWYWRGRWNTRIRASAFFYPRGYAYRHWSVGAILPALFLSSTYFYDDVGPLGLQIPPPGYRWVRYGPDLLLVNIRTGSVEEVAYGAFY